MAPDMRITDWLDDLCVRFIINLPREELESVPRICFQIEEAHWFYEDFIRPTDPSLPSMNLRKFSQHIFQHCPLFAGFEDFHAEAYESFMAYKTRVPVRGAIMLNEDMTQAVLVKGWKKQAKWSFPRGKINKDEPDLDCAIREVWEETGYDLRAAGLVGPEEQMKSFTVNVREQEMTLFAFRGVPMDTHFEPKTRKEISKIDWYHLTDLPAGRRKTNNPQGNGADLVKENSFYCVAPFVGPLKGWIKQQHRLDKQRTKARARLGAQTGLGITDTEEAEVDIGDTTADEAPIPDMQANDPSFANLLAGLGRGYMPSDALPEVSNQAAPQTVDPAEQLKRLLSVGGGITSQTPPAGQQQHGSQPNPLLLAMLQGNQNAASYPRTPVEQFIPPPTQPRSPHGQHHPRPPHLDQLPPPPPFPFQSRPGPQFVEQYAGLQHAHVQTHQPSNGFHSQIPPHLMVPPPQQHNPTFSTHAPNVQAAYNQQAPRPYERTGDPQFAQPPSFPNTHGPAIPPASKLSLPKLTAHSLELLNAFKAQEKPAPHMPQYQTSMQPPPSSQTTPQMHHQTSFPQHQQSYTSQQPSLNPAPYAQTPPTFQSPPTSGDLQPAQPKPTSAAHQASLLNLFRTPSALSATTPPPRGLEPAELSAMPVTPGLSTLPSQFEVPGPPNLVLRNKPTLLETLGQTLSKPDITTATVSGPVNVPDFDTVKKNIPPGELSGNSRGTSPLPPIQQPKKQFMPQQILKRSPAKPQAVPVEAPAVPKVASVNSKASPGTSSATTTPQAMPFRPQILKRPQQNPSPATGPGPAPLLSYTNPPAQARPAVSERSSISGSSHTFDRRDSQPASQRNALLSLFSKPTQPAVSPTPAAASPVLPPGMAELAHGAPVLQTRSHFQQSPVPMSKSPMPHQPPTPKSVVSGVISPVSPLPSDGAQHSPANVASRSRISSIGDTMPPNLVIPKDLIPTSDPMTAIHRNGFQTLEDGYASAGSGSFSDAMGMGKGKGKAANANEGAKSPVDKTFLMGFLEDVARKGR